MRRVLLAMSAAVALALCARGAAATVGGPELARVLGWDHRLQRVYVQIVHTDDDEYTPTIWYFDLKSDRPGAPQRLDWSGAEEDPFHRKRVADLRRRLKPLVAEEEVESMLRFEFEPPTRYDSVESDDGHRQRYLARVAPGPAREEHFRVLTLDPGRHAVRCLRQYALPGSRMTLMILSTEAVPMEEGYEFQFPVLAGGAGTADPIDPETFNVRR